jgi:hypothetical protein
MSTDAWRGLSGPELEFSRRVGFARGQIMEALGDLAAVSNIPEVYRAERALRYAIAELDGKARCVTVVGDTLPTIAC